jgi:D-3-phosphoglycerate dehydrogenase
MKAVILESLGISEVYLKELEEPFLKQGVVFESYERTSDAEKLMAEGKDADVIFVANMPLGNEIIQSYEKLKYIDVAFTGVDHIGLQAAKEKHVTVANAAGYSNEAVAELAVGGVLESLRYLPQVEDNCRQSRTKENYLGNEIKGKTVGIIGLGKIGMRSAELFHAFGAEILANKKHPAEVPAWITLTSKEEIYQKADIIVLHCPLNEETRGMIAGQQLAMMKPTCVLVNLARGPVVNTADLADALNKHQIGGAVLDVFDQEPPLSQDHPFLHTPNTIVMPHIGFATKEAMEIRAQIVFQNLQSWMDGKPENIVL